MEFKKGMTQKEGYQYAVDNNLIPSRGEFYKLFKSIVRISGKDLSPNEKIMLCIIISFTDNGLEFHMSNNRLAMECGVDDLTVTRCLKRLKDAGYINTYKVYKKSTKCLIGRVIEPQKEFINQQVCKNWNEYIYEQY